MQNRYAGDVGDFGKLGMLRQLAANRLRVGVNWYLVADEAHNDDGKHIGYLTDAKFLGCDDELLGKLGVMVYSDQRSIPMLESLNLIPDATYYHEELTWQPVDHQWIRAKWHEASLKVLDTCDIVFMDPDNGLIPPSVSKGGRKSIKYVRHEEIVDFFQAGHSVVFYNHRSRMSEQAYLERFRAFFSSPELHNGVPFGIKYVRGTIRDYFFLVQPYHVVQVEKALESMLGRTWSRHFRKLPLR